METRAVTTIKYWTRRHQNSPGCHHAVDDDDDDDYDDDFDDDDDDGTDDDDDDDDDNDDDDEDEDGNTKSPDGSWCIVGCSEGDTESDEKQIGQLKAQIVFWSWMLFGWIFGQLQFLFIFRFFIDPNINTNNIPVL